MATYSSTPAVSAAVSATATVDGSGNISATLYTVAASSYAMVNLYSGMTAGTVTVTVGGRTVFAGSGANAELRSAITIYAGPSQAIAVTASGGTPTQIVTVSGVVLTNSF